MIMKEELQSEQVLPCEQESRWLPPQKLRYLVMLKDK